MSPRAAEGAPGAHRCVPAGSTQLSWLPAVWCTACLLRSLGPHARGRAACSQCEEGLLTALSSGLRVPHGRRQELSTHSSRICARAAAPKALGGGLRAEVSPPVPRLWPRSCAGPQGLPRRALQSGGQPRAGRRLRRCRAEPQGITSDNTGPAADHDPARPERGEEGWGTVVVWLLTGTYLSGLFIWWILS